MKDKFGRTIDYMRISITDRCNLRCKYCMPEDIETTSMEQLLTYEEIAEIVNELVGLGITHYRITGGEPLVRKNCAKLVQLIKQTDGVESVGLTTNGVLLEENADALKQAGLDSVNVSLDTLDPGKFKEITGSRYLSKVVKGINAAQRIGIPVKINTVNHRGLEWEPILTYASEKGITVRFIEMMPIGYGKSYMGNSNECLLNEIEAKYGRGSLAEEKFGQGPAVYYYLKKAGIKVGFISALNHKFCSGCNRIRLTSQGYLKLCLCYDNGIDLRGILRNSGQQKTLRKVMEEAILQKPMEHCFNHISEITEENAMIQIGG